MGSYALLKSGFVSYSYPHKVPGVMWKEMQLLTKCILLPPWTRGHLCASHVSAGCTNRKDCPQPQTWSVHVRSQPPTGSFHDAFVDSLFAADMTESRTNVEMWIIERGKPRLLSKGCVPISKWEDLGGRQKYSDLLYRKTVASRFPSTRVTFKDDRNSTCNMSIVFVRWDLR